MLQKHEIVFSWWKNTHTKLDLDDKGRRKWTMQNRTGLYIGNMKVGEFYLTEDEEKWVVICDDKKIGEFTRPLISRSEAAIILLTAAKQLLKIEE